MPKPSTNSPPWVRPVIAVRHPRRGGDFRPLPRPTIPLRARLARAILSFGELRRMPPARRPPWGTGMPASPPPCPRESHRGPAREPRGRSAFPLSREERRARLRRANPVDGAAPHPGRRRSAHASVGDLPARHAAEALLTAWINEDPNASPTYANGRRSISHQRPIPTRNPAMIRRRRTREPDGIHPAHPSETAAGSHGRR